MSGKFIKKVISLSLLCHFLLISSKLPSIFAQGQEYLRTRAGTLAANGEPAPGMEAPTVEYYIAVGDIMEVFVWQNPDLSKEVIVDPDGKISYPLIGRIQAAGLTIAQLEAKITEGISEYVKQPRVSLMMKKFGGNKIIVLGEVGYPGIYTYTGTINLIEAIALAGDFTDKAHMDSVIVVHGNLKENPQVRRINMVKVITRGTARGKIILEPNDVVYVPKTFVANFNKFLADIGPLMGAVTQSLGVRKEIRTLQGYER